MRHCVGVANGTDAITIALRALGVGPGDEVVVPSFTFYATAEATVNAGATPVFCDVDPATFCVTPETVRAALTPRTAAIVPVHLFGNVAPVAELRELGPAVLEDAAQAAGATRDGARAGSLGDAATFSFFPSKNLGGLGDGGAITTDDDALAATARRLRFHGSEDKRTHTEVGYNSRLDSLQAAVLRVLLPHLDAANAARRAAAVAYREHGLGELVELPATDAGVEHAHHLYVVRTERPGRPGRRARAARDRSAGLLPHARPPPARDGPLGAPGGLAPGDRRSGPDQPRAAHGPRADRAPRWRRSSRPAPRPSARAGQGRPRRPRISRRAWSQPLRLVRFR